MKKFTFLLPLFLVACSSPRPAVETVMEQKKPVEIKKISLSELCLDVESNQLRGELFWKNKIVAVPVTVAKIGSTYDYSTFVDIHNKKILSVLARSPSDLEGVLSVSKNDKVIITGKIDTVRVYEYQKDSYEMYHNKDIGHQAEHPYCRVELNQYTINK